MVYTGLCSCQSLLRLVGASRKLTAVLVPFFFNFFGWWEGCGFILMGKLTFTIVFPGYRLVRTPKRERFLQLYVLRGLRYLTVDSTPSHHGFLSLQDIS